MIHVMLDLETWGTRPGCDIRSIGACVFDPVAGIVNTPLKGWKNSDPDSKLFYVATENPIIRPERVEVAPGQFEVYHLLGEGFTRYSLHRDPSTVKWWSEQSAEAQAAFADPVDLKDACGLFVVWLGSIGAAYDTVRIWAHDPHFDVSILEAVYHAVGLPVPWHYRAPRSLRTITEAAGMTRDDFAAFNHGTAHNALDDAIAQAGIVCEAFKRLNLARS